MISFEGSSRWSQSTWGCINQNQWAEKIKHNGKAIWADLWGGGGSDSKQGAMALLKSSQIISIQF